MLSQARVRFSIRTLFIIICIAAVLIVGGIKFIYVHPTYRLPSYERATPIRGTVARLGDSSVAIQAVARNERDNALYCEDGKGSAVDAQLADPLSLQAAAAWLDVARIELDTPKFAVIRRLRLFDHEARDSIASIGHGRVGFHVDQHNDILIYGVGYDLPTRLDVWIDIRRFDASVPPARLNAAKDASLKLNDDSLAVTSVGSGELFVQVNDGVRSPSRTNRGDTHRSYLELQYKGEPFRDRDLVAVAKDGRRVLTSELLNYGEGYAVLPIDMRLGELSHIEIRPRGSSHKFFFEDVRLPQNRGSVYAPPPVATRAASMFPVANGVRLREFDPLRVFVDVWPGAWRIKRLASEQTATADTAFTALHQLDFVNGKTVSLAGVDKDGIQILPRRNSFPNDGSDGWTSRNEVYALGSKIFDCSIEDLDSITISLSP